MSDTDLLIQDHAMVRTITLNRPDAKNTLTGAMLGELVDATRAADEAEGIRAIVLTNTGNTFCAGADLTDSRPGVSGMSEDSSGTTLSDIFVALQNATTPVIGKINGHAVGGGVGLVAACDLSYVRSDAKIGFTEVRLGVAPAVISVVCLPKLSRADAMETFLTGERFTPDRAAEMGLINAAVAPEDLDSHVQQVIDKILLGGPAGVAAAKQIVNSVPAMARTEAFEKMTALSQALFDGAEARAGIAAFRERRPAPWAPVGDEETSQSSPSG
ncbi:MAG: enoyl-CoA hydratase/isomerase family protein [Acidimicrobiia bacterium]|nr:enoyl-CoA hydratase/isomerase family protein [Acidimicrobiia bacterium]